MAARAAALAEPQLAERQREVVGHDEQVGERGVLAGQDLAHGEARVVHERQRLDQREVQPAEAPTDHVGRVALPATAVQPARSASRSITSQPTLWRVPAYCDPGSPGRRRPSPNLRGQHDRARSRSDRAHEAPSGGRRRAVRGWYPRRSARPARSCSTVGMLTGDAPSRSCRSPRARSRVPGRAARIRWSAASGPPSLWVPECRASLGPVAPALGHEARDARSGPVAAWGQRAQPMARSAGHSPRPPALGTVRTTPLDVGSPSAERHPRAGQDPAGAGRAAPPCLSSAPPPGGQEPRCRRPRPRSPADRARTVRAEAGAPPAPRRHRRAGRRLCGGMGPTAARPRIREQPSFERAHRRSSSGSAWSQPHT